MVRPLGFPRPIPAVPSIEGHEIYQQYNVVRQIHEIHYEFCAGGVAVQDDKRQVQLFPELQTVL